MSTAKIPIPDILDLEGKDCPLLKKYPDRLVVVLEKFNAAVEIAKQLAAKFADMLDQQKVKTALDLLSSTHKALITERFKVGFLGRFQSGKSTMLNNVVGQKISPVGGGGACTSVVTRLIVGPPEKEAELTLVYFTEDEYRDRRKILCEWAQLQNSAGRSEEQLLEMLQNPPPLGRSRRAARPVRQKDIPYLRAFLQSYADNVRNGITWSQAQAYKDYRPFDRENAKTLAHPDEDDYDQILPSPYLLLAESTIMFPTGQWDPEVELVDCPGLGSGRSVDDLLTTKYIQELQGP